MKNSMLSVLIIVIFSVSAVASPVDLIVRRRDPRGVSEINENPRRFDNRRIQVVGYISEVNYLLHDRKALLTIKLAQERLEPEDLRFGYYLLLQEDGFNVGILRTVFEHLEVLQREGRRIVAEGQFDGDMNAVALYSLFLRYEFDERWERYEIDTDRDDIHICCFCERMRREGVKQETK